MRKTISMPPATAASLDQEAKRRGLSFSALILERIAQRLEPLSYAGLIADDPDLSDRVEEVLARILR